MGALQQLRTQLHRSSDPCTPTRSVVKACNASTLTEHAPERDVDCRKEFCGFYLAKMSLGKPQPGSSGGGVILEKEAKVVGVASGLTDALVCPTDFPDNDGDAYSAIASLARVGARVQ